MCYFILSVDETMGSSDLLPAKLCGRMYWIRSHKCISACEWIVDYDWIGKHQWVAACEVTVINNRIPRQHHRGCRRVPAHNLPPWYIRPTPHSPIQGHLASPLQPLGQEITSPYFWRVSMTTLSSSLSATPQTLMGSEGWSSLWLVMTIPSLQMIPDANWILTHKH